MVPSRGSRLPFKRFEAQRRLALQPVAQVFGGSDAPLPRMEYPGLETLLTRYVGKENATLIEKNFTSAKIRDNSLQDNGNGGNVSSTPMVLDSDVDDDAFVRPRAASQGSTVLRSKWGGGERARLSRARDGLHPRPQANSCRIH